MTRKMDTLTRNSQELYQEKKTTLFNSQLDGDIVHILIRTRKEGLEKNKKLMAVQQEARQKHASQERRGIPARLKDSKAKIAGSLAFPPISVTKKQGKAVLNSRARKGSDLCLPSLINKQNTKVQTRLSVKYNAVLDPRFKGLLSSLVDISDSNGQIQRISPPKGKTLRPIIRLDVKRTMAENKQI